MKLTIELVPKTSWYSNVRSNVSSEQWDIIRRKSYRNANYKCEICNGIGVNHPVECHEIWEYDVIAKNKKQTLIGFISLCPNCHKVKHPGLAEINGEMDIVINQLIRVNDMTKNEAVNYISDSFRIWRQRNNFEWEVDISFVNSYK